MSDPVLPTPPRLRVPLVRQMARAWGALLLRGAVSVLFGLAAFLAPGLGLAVMLGFLAAWMAVDGASTLYQAVKGPPERHGAWFWLDGIVSLAAAGFVLLAPVASALTIVFVTGLWLVAVGLVRLWLAFRLSSVLMGLLGALAVFFGAWLIAAPGPGLLAILWLVGLQAVLAGALLIGLGWRLRRVAQDPHHPG